VPRGERDSERENKDGDSARIGAGRAAKQREIERAGKRQGWMRKSEQELPA